MNTELKIKRLPDAKIELRWHSLQGFSYELEHSNNLSAWTKAGTFQGTGDDIVIIVAAFDEVGYYRVLVSIPQGSEPETWTVTYLDGSKVEVHWVPFGVPVPSGQFQISRDGVLIGVVTGDSDYFVDENVEAGKTYAYTVGYYS